MLGGASAAPVPFSSVAPCLACVAEHGFDDGFREGADTVYGLEKDRSGCPYPNDL